MPAPDRKPPDAKPSRPPWGKADKSTGAFHHLAHHCADVAACFEAIIALPVIRARLEHVLRRPLTAVVRARLAVLAFLHDVGKLHSGFQAKAWPPGSWPWGLHGHLAEGAAVLLGIASEAIARNLHVDDLAQWGTPADLAFAALAHHGRPFRVDDPYASQSWEPAPAAGYDPIAASAELGAAMRSWFPEAFTHDDAPLPESTDFQQFFCGLVSLADWIGANRSIFGFVENLDPDYIRIARSKAHKAIASIGLDVSLRRERISGRTSFTALTGFHAPRAQQRLVGEFPPQEQLVILEAETGSGKTEAALWRFARLLEAGRVDSLYFALPTRAAAVQLQARTTQALRRLFGDLAPEPVLAVPGYLRAGDAHGTALPDWQVRWDDTADADEEQLLSRWAAENARRYLAAMVAVGTVDQAMLAALQVKHAHLRSAALSRSLLVIDEVHASDRYMTEIQAHLLETHLNRGGYAMLMSATLGSVARARWLGQAQPVFAAAVDAPYPAVWGKAAEEPHSSPATGEQKHVAMALVPTMAAEEAARRAIEAAGAGARVLVIRNTVDAAVRTFEAVRAAGMAHLLLSASGAPALHHSRFAPEDRLLLDAAAEAALSPTGRQPQGVIVIGTQTLEQSLDIDADLLITDLCPIDVLLQRIGRLHRHRITRPHDFESPHCLVMLPERGLDRLLEPAFENGLGRLQDGGGIYPDLSILELTRRLAETHSIWRIPAMNRMLVESATHPERIEALHAELGDRWADYRNTIHGRQIAEAGAARGVLLRLNMRFSELLFGSDEEIIRTRLGAEGARVAFPAPAPGPFGQEVTGVTLPAHWSKGLDTREPVTPVIASGVMEFQIGDRRFTYDRLGVSRRAKSD